MKQITRLIILLILLIPIMSALVQEDTQTIQLEITGVNASDAPTITITANVVDSRNNQPILGLSPDNFELTGALAERAEVVSVANITDNNLSFSSVLVIDTSSSMAESPLELAKEAAQLFVDSTGDADPISLLIFNDRVRVVQDFVVDKPLINQQIGLLGYGGQTALYDAVVAGIQQASNAPDPRRAVIVLSDGAEFGGASTSTREDSIQRTIVGGVPVYTIGLGYGVDRSYLETVASNTNGRFYESPTPEELSEIFSAIASLLRTQYVITLRINDYDYARDAGQNIDFNLQLNTANSTSNLVTSNARIPAPTPVIRLPQTIFDNPLAGITTVTPQIIADDAITSLTAQIGEDIVPFTEGTLTIDPVAYAPGTYTLTIEALDENSDSGQLSADFVIDALASRINLGIPDDIGVITEPLPIEITAEGQTPAEVVVFALNGVTVFTDEEAPFAYTVDPITLEEGDNTLTVTVTNTGGINSSASANLSIGQVAPRITGLSGLPEEGAIDEETSLTIDRIVQNGVTLTSSTYTLGDVIINGDSFTLDPLMIPPGINTLDVALTDSNGQVVTQTFDIDVASLAPVISLGGLEADETLMADRTITLTARSQTPIASATYQFNNEAPITLEQGEDGGLLPIDIILETLGDGTQTLAVTVTNESGETSRLTQDFMVMLPTPTPNLQATSDALATSTADAIAQQILESTVSAELTSTSQARVDAQSTLDAVATSSAQSTLDADATNIADASNALAQATTDAQQTVEASNALAQATADAQQTVEAGNALAQATTDAQQTADAQQTVEAGNALAQATADAQQTANAQQLADVQQTADAQSTLDAEATNNAPTETPEPTLTHTPTATSTVLPTLTPVEIVEIDSAESPPVDGDLPLSTLLIIGVGLFLLIILLLPFFRRRNNNQ